LVVTFPPIIQCLFLRQNKIEEEAAEAERKIIKKHEASKVAVYKKRDEAAKTEPEFWKTAFEAFAMFELAPLGVWGEGDQAALESLETVEVTRTGEDLYTISVKMTFKADESRPFKVCCSYFDFFGTFELTFRCQFFLELRARQDRQARH